MESNKKIVHVITFVSLLFLSIIVYLTYIQIFEAESIAKNTYNKRQWAREDNSIRGTIYDRFGVVLAETKVGEDGTMTRIYPHKRLYSHAIGYSSKQYGKTGVESYYNNQLLNLTGDGTVGRIKDTITGEPIKGHNLMLTLDHDLQKMAESLLKGKTGSIVALNPKTGEVLAMVSKPDYNPNTLLQDWPGLVEDVRSPLLNRSLSGLYPPGSIFKPIIGAAVLENSTVDPEYDCTGSIDIDGYVLTDSNKKGHGVLNLEESVVVSCNTNFGRMGVELGNKKVTEIANRFFMNGSLGGDMPIVQSRYPYDANMAATDVAAVSIGQGKLLVTPIHMAAVAATFANNGVMMEPFIVNEVRTSEGRLLHLTKSKGTQIVSSNVASEMSRMMEAAVNRGTGTNAKISGVNVAGKTGTAENETGKSHSWFIGFAPLDNPQIAIAVILESEGKSGGAAAAPIAREIIRQGLKGVR